jgi:dual specificity phosphatase 12
MSLDESFLQVTIDDKSLAEPLENNFTFKLLKCRKCRKLLCQSKDIIVHEEGMGRFAFDHRKNSDFSVSCTSYFIHPPDWMSLDNQTTESKLYCPHCHWKIGSFNWSGTQCSCGQWITPSFAILKKSVDEEK